MWLRNPLVPISITFLLLISLYGLLRLPEVADLTIPEGSEAVQRGEYLVNAGGCISCHQNTTADTLQLSGGMELESEFGVFYVPNITPDVDTGIGGWSGRDFLLAMKHGRSPEGGFYFPVFPYRSYAGMADSDVLDIAAYLLSMPAVDSVVPAHEKPSWLFGWMMTGWNILADLREPSSETFEEPQLQRGAYLARNLGHCGECHTPRNVLGIPDWSREFVGAELGDGHVEAIDTIALVDWSEEDFAFFLFLGMKPDGEYVGGEMEPVIEHNTSRLTEEDRQALAAFFKRDPNSNN
ncbi:MAG: cytochrome c [Gammaproteobacteria bacterium]|nr:cytochrome c [Gammaproteobacteria bacterium]